MLVLLGIVLFIVGLLASIALHEVGHMVPAKKFGVRVSEYFVGFGPTLWSRQGKETEYGIKAIPLGGYVKLVGMMPPEEAVKPVRGHGRIARLIADTRAAAVEEIREGEDHRAFYHLTWWRKVIVMFGGPVVNLIIAVVLFTIVGMGVGSFEPTTTVGAVAKCVPSQVTAECTAADPASPASQAGLQEGDVFVSVDGTPVASWEETTAVIAANPDATVPVVVARDGENVELTVTLASATRDGKEVGYLGVIPTSELVTQGPLSGVTRTAELTGAVASVIATLPQHVYHAALAAVGVEERSADSVIGIVGVGRISGEIVASDIEGYDAKLKTADMLNLLAGLNLALFAFNMIPLVPLDGGHIASALWQGIKNGWARVRRLPKPSPVDVARMMPLAYGVFGLLILMGVVLIVADIVAPVSVS